MQFIQGIMFFLTMFQKFQEKYQEKILNKIEATGNAIVKKLESFNDKISPMWAKELGTKNVSFATDFFWKFFLPFLCIVGEYAITLVDVKERYIKFIGVLTFFGMPIAWAKVYNADYVKRLMAAGNESRAKRIFGLSKACWWASLLSPFIALVFSARICWLGEYNAYKNFVIVNAVHLCFSVTCLFGPWLLLLFIRLSVKLLLLLNRLADILLAISPDPNNSSKDNHK